MASATAFDDTQFGYLERAADAADGRATRAMVGFRVAVWFVALGGSAAAWVGAFHAARVLVG